MRTHVLALSAAAALCAAPAQAQPAQCGSLTRVFQLPLTPGPGGVRFGVPITVNGQQKQFLLSTGIPNSRIGRRAVNDLKLTPRTQGQMLQRNGTVNNAYVVETNLEIGPMKAPRHEMLVMENLAPFDGVFSRDLMQNYDIEINFAGGQLSYFLTVHCPGKVVHWATSGITSVDFNGWDNNSAQRFLTVPVLIDGHEIRAEIDTTLGETVLEADTASALFTLTPDSPGRVPLGALDNNPAHRMFGYTFQTLKIGGLTLRNPKMRIVPDIVGTKSTDTLRADSRVQRRTDEFMPTMQIGMDVLRRLHLYVATKEQKIYFTGAAGQAVNSTPPAGQAPAQPAAN